MVAIEIAFEFGILERPEASAIDVRPTEEWVCAILACLFQPVVFPIPASTSSNNYLLHSILRHFRS